MSTVDRDRTAQEAKRWALLLTGQASVTGSRGEAAFGPWLAGELRSAFGPRAEIWTEPVAEGDGRHSVFMLLRGRGRQTAILTGHYDTVSLDDYGALRGLATEPVRLGAALKRQLASDPDRQALALADLESGLFLPGRGLLDMKAGLAAGLAVCAGFAAESDGNLLFIAVPDEENNSAGARAVMPVLHAIAGRRGLELLAAINLDAIADKGDGSQGRVIALGTVGKVLPTAFVVGVPTHSGFPLNGLNAGALAAAIAARVEWAAELTDSTAEQAGTPPSLLSLKDGKAAYDVTTPAAAFATFNVLSFRRPPAEVLDRFEALCREAVAGLCEALAGRVGGAGGTMPDVSFHRYAEVVSAAVARDPGSKGRLSDLARELAGSALPLPEQCRLMTEQAWAASGLAGPAVVTGFGSIPYLPTNLSDTAAAERLRRAAQRVAERAAERHGSPVTCVPYFAGISDMSFFGEADTGDLTTLAANTPQWEASVRWPAGQGTAGIPTINIGPWGRDYHTPYERMHEPYGFQVLPALLAEVLAELGIRRVG